jgi:hypothetical protein
MWKKNAQIHHHNRGVQRMAGGYPEPYAGAVNGGEVEVILFGRPPQLSTDAWDEQIEVP